MESLLKLSGLLGGDDDDRTDLGTLEKRLADKAYSQSSAGTPRSSKSGSQPRNLESPQRTPQMDKLPSPRDSVASPGEPPKEKEEAVEDLSDMMCSLVTNNCGETRYIGESKPGTCQAGAYNTQDLLLAFLYSLRKEYNGSTTRLATTLSKT